MKRPSDEVPVLYETPPQRARTNQYTPGMHCADHARDYAILEHRRRAPGTTPSVPHLNDVLGLMEGVLERLRHRRPFGMGVERILVEDMVCFD